jgi:syntaxin 16
MPTPAPHRRRRRRPVFSHALTPHPPTPKTNSLYTDRPTAKLLDGAGGRRNDSGGDVEMGALRGGGGGGLNGANNSALPGWVQRSERVKGEMATLRGRLAQLREAHAKALLVSFGGTGGGPGGGANNTNNSSGARAAEALTREVQLSFRRLDGEIRALGRPDPAYGVDGRPKPTANDDDGGVRLQVQRQLAQHLFRLSVEFRKEETRFLNKMEAQRGLEKGSTMGLLAEDLERSGGGAGGLGGGGGAAGACLHQQALLHGEALAQERDAEIVKVVEAITELAQIMRDLSTLVVEQGTMLDRVDANITGAAVKVEEGVRELVRAERSQRKGSAAVCISALLVMIAVMLIVVILRHL